MYKRQVYCETDVDGKHTGHDMGMALKKRIEMGFTFLKMDLGIGLLLDEPGTINAPLGFIDDMKKYAPHILNVQGLSLIHIYFLLTWKLEHDILYIAKRFAILGA